MKPEATRFTTIRHILQHSFNSSQPKHHPTKLEKNYTTPPTTSSFHAVFSSRIFFSAAFFHKVYHPKTWKKTPHQQIFQQIPPLRWRSYKVCPSACNVVRKWPSWANRAPASPPSWHLGPEKIHSPQRVGSEKGREMGHGQNCGFGGKLYIIGPDFNGTHIFWEGIKECNFLW